MPKGFMKKLSELLDLHVALDGMFFEHQSALLRFEFEAALDCLDRYEACLLVHMQDEENVLLPVYAERAVIDRSGTVQMFRDEHAKMRAFIELFKRQIGKLASEPHPNAGLIMLLDREAFYKRLVSHHDKREREFLFPALDSVTSDAEKVELLGRVTCSFEFAAVGAS